MVCSCLVKSYQQEERLDDKEIEEDRFTLSSSKPFDQVVAALNSAVQEKSGCHLKHTGNVIETTNKETNMKGSTPREIPFTGVRLRFDSNKSFDEVLSALLADVGDKPLLINEVADNSDRKSVV